LPQTIKFKEGHDLKKSSKKEKSPLKGRKSIPAKASTKKKVPLAERKNIPVKVSTEKRAPLEGWRNILVKRRETILREQVVPAREALRKALEVKSKPAETSSHIADCQESYETTLETLNSAEDSLKKIDHAIIKVDKGTFGKCLNPECAETGEIEIVLLVNDPGREFCKECQEVQNEKDEQARKIKNFRGGPRRHNK
jgi:RNA polymerase-binding transcription factor DksA